MNFLSHFYLDQHVDDSLYIVGIATPDLLSIFDSNVRLKERKLPIPMENSATPEQLSIYNGALRHFHVDRIFHSSDFFHKETQLISRLLKAEFKDPPIHRGFFIGHILLELVMDRILVQKDINLVHRYYTHFEKFGVKLMEQKTEWLCRRPLPGYDAFLVRFIERKHLHYYKDWDFLKDILRRMLNYVQIDNTQFIDHPAFIEIMEKYQAGLSLRCPAAFAKFSEQLIRK